MSASTEVVAIIQEIWGSQRDIQPSTRIYQDLHIAGDDAFELVERIHQKFGTSFEGFRFDEYFPNETEALGCYIASLFRLDRSRKTLTVQHLLDVVRAGRWIEPDER